MSRESLDYKHNPQFTDETAASIVISDTIYVMLLTHAKFKQFTPKEIANPTKACGVLLSLSCESRSAVDDLVAKAIAVGGSKAHDPEDYGFMYQSGFYAPDGHGWGYIGWNRRLKNRSVNCSRDHNRIRNGESIMSTPNPTSQQDESPTVQLRKRIATILQRPFFRLHEVVAMCDFHGHFFCSCCNWVTCSRRAASSLRISRSISSRRSSRACRVRGENRE